jgi:hypothetical protein
VRPIAFPSSRPSSPFRLAQRAALPRQPSGAQSAVVRFVGAGQLPSGFSRHHHARTRASAPSPRPHASQALPPSLFPAPASRPLPASSRSGAAKPAWPARPAQPASATSHGQPAQLAQRGGPARLAGVDASPCTRPTAAHGLAVCRLGTPRHPPSSQGEIPSTHPFLLRRLSCTRPAVHATVRRAPKPEPAPATASLCPIAYVQAGVCTCLYWVSSPR